MFVLCNVLNQFEITTYFVRLCIYIYMYILYILYIYIYIYYIIYYMIYV